MVKMRGVEVRAEQDGQRAGGLPGQLIYHENEAFIERLLCEAVGDSSIILGLVDLRQRRAP